MKFGYVLTSSYFSSPFLVFQSERPRKDLTSVYSKKSTSFIVFAQVSFPSLNSGEHARNVGCGTQKQRRQCYEIAYTHKERCQLY